MVKKIIEGKKESKEFYWLWLVAFIFVSSLLFVLVQIYRHQQTRAYWPIVFEKNNYQAEIDTKSFVSSTNRQLAKLRPQAKQLAAVIIDNHFEAWENQYGLSQAPVVYNIPVEGGATRIMALFDIIDDLTLIGPVRSVRPYYLDFLEEYNALLVHVGGSPAALERIANSALINNLNEMTGPGQYYFSRSTGLPAPHNTFTDTEKLRQAVIDFAYQDNLSFRTINYAATQPVGLNEQEIFIDYSARRTYDIIYRWDVATQGYQRYRVDDLQLDALTGLPLLVANLVIMQVPPEVVLDDLLRIDLQVIGTGEARFFKNGQQYEGYWQKDSSSAETKFYLAGGGEYEFTVGNIWIEVVPANRLIEVE